MGKSWISKNLKVYGKEKDLGFHRAFGTFLFFRSKFSRGSGRSSSVPIIIDSWLDSGAYVLVRDGSVKEGRNMGWLLCLSCLGLFQQDPGWVSTDGSRFSDSPFSTWQLHRPFLQHVMARPHYIFRLYAEFFPTQESRTWGMQTIHSYKPWASTTSPLLNT